MQRSQEVVEGIRVRLEPAPLFQRTLAAMIDMGIVGAATYAMIIPMIFFFGVGMALDKALSGNLGVFSIVVMIVYLLIMMAGMHSYYVWFEYTKGATPGKKVMGLKVISVDGKKLTKGQAVYRELVKWYLDALFFIPAAISMMVTQRRQRVGDVLAGTMVVYSRTREESQQYIYVKQEDYKAILAHLQVPVISPELRKNFLVVANRAYLLNEQARLQNELAQWSAYFRDQLAGQAEKLDLNDTTVLRFMAEHCFQLDRQENEKKGWKNG